MIIEKRKRKKIRLKIGDKVRIISGKEKGQIGLISLIIIKKQKVIIKGLNMKIKHKKSKHLNEKSGQIIKIEAPIHISNVVLI
ncbi:MAG: 50S ribosomal protein L24 [Alphaproteobacteria bacterium]|nr:50S ribosomal protein L24 [Alphaproteobacteria bacterium]